jgi:UDP-N-acetyl-D-mannosaminuronate dehydrogenase
LPDIDEALGYFAGNAKSEVALNAGGDNACECAIPLFGLAYRRNTDQIRQSPGIS